MLHLKQPSTIPEYSDLEIEYWVQVGNKKVLNVGGGRLVTIGRGRIGEESRNHGGVEQDDVSLGGRGRGMKMIFKTITKIVKVLLEIEVKVLIEMEFKAVVVVKVGMVLV